MALASHQHVHVALHVDAHRSLQVLGRDGDGSAERYGTGLLATEATSQALHL